VVEIHGCLVYQKTSTLPCSDVMSVFGGRLSEATRVWNPRLASLDEARHLQSNQTAPILSLPFANTIHGLQRNPVSGSFESENPLDESSQSVASIVARHEQLHGTGSDYHPEHVRLGLLGMNGGRVTRTITQLALSNTSTSRQNILLILNTLSELSIEQDDRILAPDRILTWSQMDACLRVIVDVLAANTTIKKVMIDLPEDPEDANRSDWLLALSGNTSITQLHLTGDSVYNFYNFGGSNERETINALAGNTTLRELVIVHVFCHEHGQNGHTKYLTERLATSNSTLIKLSLVGMSLQEDDAIVLASNQTLQELCLEDNGLLGTAGVQALAANTTLHKLNIAFVDTAQLGDEAPVYGLDVAQALAANTTLQSLDVFGTGFDEECKDALRKAYEGRELII